MSRVVAVVGEDAAKGFALTGMRTFVCTTAQEALAAIRSPADNIGIIVVDERFTEALDPRTRKELERQTSPLIVPVPISLVWDPGDAVKTDDLIAKLIRQAVGYQLNIHL